MSFGSLMAFVRANFPSDEQRNGSILKHLLQRYKEPEVDVMLKGAALMHWKSLLGLNSKDGIGRRWATTRYWMEQNRFGAKDWKPPEELKQAIRRIFA